MQYLNVPFDDNQIVKALGAVWDKEEKRWYISEYQKPELFTRWLPVAPQAAINSHLCAIAGCGNPGSMSHSTTGSGPWMCKRHFFGEDNSAPMSHEDRKEKLQHMAYVVRNAGEWVS